MSISEPEAAGDGGKRHSLEPADYLLSKSGLLALLGGLVAAAWYHQVLIAIALSLFLSTAGLAKLWSRFSLAGVTYQRLLNVKRAFPGEQIEFRMKLMNGKVLPVPWIQVDDVLPAGFATDASLTPSGRAGFFLLSKAAALLWYRGVSWRHSLTCDRRGYYSLGPAIVTSGDIFALYPRSIAMAPVDHIIVYPKIFPISRLGIPSLFPIGETVAQQRIFEDPIRVIGVRDYCPQDSLRRIHWKASARHQSLQVKVFEPTTTLKVAVFLVVDSFRPQQGEKYDHENLELGISAAASIANYLIMEQRSAVGFFANSRLADSSLPARISPASGAGQFAEILEAMAKVTRRSSGPFVDFLQAERAGLPWGTTMVFIISRPSPSLMGLLIDLKERGYGLLVFQVGEPGSGESSHGIAWHHLKHPDELIKAGVRGTA